MERMARGNVKGQQMWVAKMRRKGVVGWGLTAECVHRSLPESGRPRRVSESWIEWLVRGREAKLRSMIRNSCFQPRRPVLN